MNENGEITRNKVRLVAQRYSQEERIDFEETYAPMARLEVIRNLLAFDILYLDPLINLLLELNEFSETR